MALNPALDAPSLRVMNFLNEVTLDYPDAISFAPGRPADAFVKLPPADALIERFVAHRVAEGVPRARVERDLGQYGRTAGIIGDLIARHLELDESIRVPASAVMVTTGAQEGMSILLQGLFDRARDVCLVTDPSYVGMTGAAQILGVPTAPVAVGEAGLELAALEDAIARATRAGRRVRVLYDVPDFHNPSGTRVPLATRHAILALARAHDFLVIEDNPYGRFCYEGERLPTLKSLDDPADPRVIYLGTFSKTLFPGLRLGYVVADQPGVADTLSMVKSLTTVNTSPILQAIAGGFLIEQGFSMTAHLAPRIAVYKASRDRMLAALDQHLGGLARWNRPAGGFFLTVTTDAPWDEARVKACARDPGVIVCPMTFFSDQPGHERTIRLSFSNLRPEDTDEGVARLARFLQRR